MNVAVAFDHRGVHLRERVLETLRGAGHTVVDLGTDTDAVRIDYPDKAREIGEAIRDGRAERGVLVCGSGVGAAVAACKIAGIRAAICHDVYSAHQGVEHDDMNVLCLGSEVVGAEPRRRPRAHVPRCALHRRRPVRRTAQEGGSDGKGDGQWLSRTCTSSRSAAQSVWIDYLSRDMLERGRAGADDARGRRRRRHVEPDDLPEGDLARRPRTTSS